LASIKPSSLQAALIFLGVGSCLIVAGVGSVFADMVIAGVALVGLAAVFATIEFLSLTLRGKI
jgi:hypothetical protein